MSTKARVLLCVSCAVVGAIEAPRAIQVLSEDLAGPYPRVELASADRASPAVMVFTDPAPEEVAEDLDALHADIELLARGDER
jgi:hypothetical protein